MTKSVRLKDIAEIAGVSTVTVSKALSGQKGMSAAVREKIQHLANEMGYVPPVSHKVDRLQKNYTIGVLVSDNLAEEVHAYYAKLYRQLAQFATERGCFTILEIVTAEAEKDLHMPMIISNKKIDGVIAIGAFNSKYIDNIKHNSNIDIIHFGYSGDLKVDDAVLPDSFNGACYMTEYLIERGHKNIAFVGTVLSSDTITDRYIGYRKALLKNNIEFNDKYVIEDRDVFASDVDAENYLILPKDMPTAFVCNCDKTAAFLIRKLGDKGYRVPEDVSVVGFDSFTYQGIEDVKITSYNVSCYDLCKYAFDNLVKKMNKERYHHGVVLLEGTIVEGDSVKDLRE